MNINYRIATENDVEFLTRLRESTMREHVENSGLVYDEERQRERVLYGFDYARIIVFNGEDIGLLKLDRSSSEWRLMQIQLLPEYQGKGIGNTVLDEVTGGADRIGVDLTLSVYKTNRARELYRRKGFIVTGEDEHSLYLRRFSKSRGDRTEIVDYSEENDEPPERKKFLIGFIIALSIIFIASFIPWGSFRAYIASLDEVVKITMSGWNGYVKYYFIKVANWMAVLAALFNGLLILLRYFDLWKAKLLFYIPAPLVVAFHLFTTLYLRVAADRENEYRLGPGYFIFILAVIALHVIAYKYYRLEDVDSTPLYYRDDRG